MRFGLNRGQHSRHVDDDDPIKAQASWQLEHGLNAADLTPDQTERLRAVEKTGGDLVLANRLIYSRRRFRAGRLSEGEQPTDEMLDRAVAVSRTGSRPMLDEIE